MEIPQTCTLIPNVLGTLLLKFSSHLIPCHKHQAVISNQRSLINKMKEVLDDQTFTDYLFSAINMAKHKIGC